MCVEYQNGNKMIPHKDFQYLPIIPRLQIFFISKEMSMHTKSPKEKMVVEEDVLRHIADNEAWKDFNKEFP
jgi:hypothetical protein